MTLREDIAARLQRTGDPSELWGVLEPRRAELDRDRELARAWMELIESDPRRRGAIDEARRVLAGWPDDPELVTAACAALIAIAQQRPPDEPPLAEGPAHVAAQAAGRCLDALPADGAADPNVAGYLWINRANGLRLARADDEAARSAFDRALELDPQRGGWWFDLGLFLKGRGQWREALDTFLRARARLGEQRGVLWNIAVAATALGEGDLAAGTWRKLGVPADVDSRTGMPYVPDMPAAQLRVPSRGGGTAGSSVPDEAAGFEVVWVAPLSPCHGVVQTPTFRQAPVDYGDLVLWDGTPVGVETHDGERVPRFPLLASLRAGDEHRFRFVGMQQAQGDVHTLGSSLPAGAFFYVHTERVEQLCPLCASGEVMRKHDHLPAEEHRIVYGKLIVPASVSLGSVREALEQAIRERGKVALAIPGLYETLGETKTAGQQHQAWRGIERSAIKRGLAST